MRGFPFDPNDRPSPDPGDGLALDLDSDSRAGLTAEILDALDRVLDPSDQSTPAMPAGADRSVINRLLAGPPEGGTDDIAMLLDTVLEAAATGFDTTTGGHLSYIPNGGLYTGALGRFLAAALNRHTATSSFQPGAVALEQSVVNWMLDLFGLGSEAGGLLLSGGSTATLEAVITARVGMGTRFDDAVIYVADSAHHSVIKAARLAGIDPSMVRLIPVDNNHRLDSFALRRAVSADRRAGHRPMMIVATAGTTDIGAVDPLAECAAIAEANGAWFHVDAAYGGFFQLTDRGRALLTGIERADSITVDPHKGLLAPYGIGGLLVADGQTLRTAHQGQGRYMQDCVAKQGLPEYAAHGIELTRPWRGLDLWLPLHLHGVARFRITLDHMLDLAQQSARRLARLPGIELVAEPTLSIVAFRCAEGDRATQELMNRINRSGDIHVSSTTIGSRMAIRFAFLSHRTTPAVADQAVELVAQAVVASTRGRALARISG